MSFLWLMPLRYLLFCPPQPAQRIRQDRAAVFTIVSAGTVLKLVIVAGKLQRERHVLIRQRPTAVLVIEIAGAVLQKHTDWLHRFGFANQRRINVAAPDICKAANLAEHFSERFGPLPCNGKRTDAARTHSTDGAHFRVVGEFVLLADFRQNFLQQELGVLIAERVVLEAAVVALPRI